MKILKILILFILLFIMESCNKKKVDVKKIDFSISNEKMKHSNDEEIFQKLLFNIDINKYRETDISTIGFFCLVNLKTNEIITEDLVVRALRDRGKNVRFIYRRFRTISFNSE